MLGMEDEEDVKSPDEGRVRLVLLVVEEVQHVEEILYVLSINRLCVLSTNSMSERLGSNGGSDSKDLVEELVSSNLVLK